jgi:hypothetical protein
MVGDVWDRNTWTTIPVSEQKMTLNNQTKQVEQTEAKLEVIKQKRKNANQNNLQGEK